MKGSSRTSKMVPALARILAGVLLIGALVFLPAGTFDYWQAWLYTVVLFAPLLIMTIVLLIADPDFLGRRMNLRESQGEQKLAIAGLSLLMIVMLLIPGFDRRYGWSMVPTVLVLVSDTLILVGFLIFGLTLRENRFAGRVVEVQEGQVVISTGPYALVRHPMYLAATLIFGFTPLALGSYDGLIASVLFPVLLAARISNEEKVLCEGLKGYEEYSRKMRWRLIPFIW